MERAPQHAVHQRNSFKNRLDDRWNGKAFKTSFHIHSPPFYKNCLQAESTVSPNDLGAWTVSQFEYHSIEESDSYIKECNTVQQEIFNTQNCCSLLVSQHLV